MQGTHYFLNINSGRWVARNHWTALPMPNEVKQTIHRLTGANKKHKGIVFTDKNGNIINDNSPKEPNNTEITGVRNKQQQQQYSINRNNKQYTCG